MKPWHTSKTLWVNILTLAVLILGTLAARPELDAYAPTIATALAVVNVVLRFVTSKGLR